jgi:hypothetical protein
MSTWYAWCKEHLTTQKLHPLQKGAVVGLLLLVSLSVSIGGVSRIVQQQVEYLLSAVLPSVIIDLTNEERGAQNLGELKRNPILDAAAKLKAEHMRKEEYFAHFSPKDGISPWHWFDVAGYDYVHAGENLAVYFDDSEKVVDAWMESPLHRDNILKSQYTEIGVAAVEGEYQGYDTVYVVQLFGTPARVPQPAPTPLPVAPSRPVLVEEIEPEVPALAGETTGQEAVALAPVEPELLAVAPVTPEFVATEEVADEPVLLADTAVVEKEEPATTTNVTMVPVGTGVALVSDHMATSTPKVPAESIYSAGSTHSTFLPSRSAFVAHDTLQMYYFIIAFLVAASLILSIVHTLHHHAHAQAFYGTGLFLVLLAVVAFHVEVVEAAMSVVILQ